MKALRAFLRPEFLNRVDAVVSFNSLTEDNFREIAGIMLRELQESLERRGIALTWDESLVDFLVKDAYSVTYGARNLRRSIQKHVEDPVSEKIIDSFMEPLHAVQLSARDGAVRLETQ